MSKPLEYYFEDGTHVIFNKYTIENGVIKNKKGEPLRYTKKGKYNRCGVRDNDGKRSRSILVGRAIASSIHGPPPTLTHTADHKDKNPENDTDENIRWLCKPGQVHNRDCPETQKSAFIVIKDGVEKTLKEWVDNLKGKKNRFGRDYTYSIIVQYAQKKQYGFSYKMYPDLQGEVWKEISGSKSKLGRWEISNMNRVKYITKYAENVLSGERFCLKNEYPSIRFDGRDWYCHILSFMTFFPEEYVNKKSGEMVLHENDEKMDFRPHKLRLGTQSENATDAYDNGCYDGTKSARMACASYINGVFEKEHESQHDAAKYLKTLGYDKADRSKIGLVLSGDRKTAYGRVWKNV